MDEVSATVELGILRDVRADEMARLHGLMSLRDLGIEDQITRKRIVTFNVFCGSHYGTVPILRLSTAYDRGRGICLSQAVIGKQCPPVMGETAVVSPISEVLLENEKQIALNAFLTAKAGFKASD